MPHEQTHADADNRGCFMPDIGEHDTGAIGAFLAIVICAAIVALIYASNQIIPGLLW